MVEPVLRTEGLEKRYGRIRALDSLTVDVPPGAVGLLGPNGAGKSTLIRLLLGLLEPDAGRATIAGFDPARRADRLGVRRVVGYMPEGDCLIPGMNAVELVATLGRITGLSKRDAMMRAHETLDYVGLEEARYRGLDEYSTGMKQRLKLAQALVHDPSLLLLDEPTNGLDPKGRKHMLEVVHDLGHAQGKNVLLCSHLLPDVERTCDRVVVIHRGRILAQGEIEDLTRNEERWLRAEVQGDAEDFAAGLGAQGLGFEREAAGTFRVAVAAEDADALFAVAHARRAVVTSLTPPRSSLEDAFLRALDEADRA